MVKTNGTTKARGQETKTKTEAQILTTASDYDKKLQQVGGGLTPKRIRQLRKDPTIALARWLANAPIIKAQWAVECNDDAPKGARELIESCMLPMQIHVMRTAAYGCTDFGWQPYEKVFSRNREGKIALAKLKPLLQDFTEILIEPDSGKFAGLYNCVQDKETWLRVEESLLLNFDVEGTDFYGQGIMANADNAQKDWDTVNDVAKRYDRKIAGAHWIIHYPDGITNYNGNPKPNFEIAEALLKNLEGSGSTAVPRKAIDATTEAMGIDYKMLEAMGWKIEILSAYPTSGPAFIERMKYVDVLKVRAFGMPERALIEGQFGTKAEAGEHADASSVNMQNRLDLILQDINKYVVNQLLKLNWGEDSINTVWISAAPINDEAIAYLRTVYEKILSDPNGFSIESANIDLDAMRDRLDIPTSASALKNRDDDTEE